MATFEHFPHVFSSAGLTFFEAKFFASALSTFVALSFTTLLAFNFLVIKWLSLVTFLGTLMSAIQADLAFVGTFFNYLLCKTFNGNEAIAIFALRLD